MVAGLKVAWVSIRDIQFKGYVYIWANIAFICLSLPIVTAPAALSALMKVGHLSQTQPHEADLSAFWEHFKTHVVFALPWGVMNLIFVIIHFSNLSVIFTLPQWLSVPTLSLWFVAVFIWSGLFLYYWPIMFEMENPKRLEVAYNAFVMILQNPLFTLMIVIILIGIAFISTLLPAAWLLLTWGFIASISNIAVLNRLDEYRGKKRG